MPANSPLLRRRPRPPSSRCVALASLGALIATLTASVFPALAQTITVTGSGASDADPSGVLVRTGVGASLDLSRYIAAEPVRDENAAPDACCFSIFRGVARDGQHGFELSLSSELARLEGSDGGQTEIFFSQLAAAELFGWRLEERVSYQKPTTFADPFWRSSRNLASVGGAITVPPMWAFGGPRWLFWAVRTRVEYAELLDRQGSSLRTAEFDLDVKFEFAGVQTASTDVGIFNFRLREFGVPLSRTGNVTTGLSASAFDLEIATVDVAIGDAVKLSSAAGIGFRSAVSPFRSVSDDGGISSVSTGTPVTHPVLWFGAQVLPSESRPLGIAFGGGSFARVSPDAYGMDRGVRGEAAGSARLGADIDLTVALDVARVVRRGLSELAPEGTDGVGTTFLLARSTATLAAPISDRLRLSGSAYAERSDRDDPRRHLSTVDRNELRYGIEISASYVFDGE